MRRIMTCLVIINFVIQINKNAFVLNVPLSTCTPRHLSATMALYLRSLGIEDGAEQARARKEVNPFFVLTKT